MSCCPYFPSCPHHIFHMETQKRLQNAAQQKVWEMSVPLPKDLGGGNTHFTYNPSQGWHVTTSVNVPGVGSVSQHDWLKDFKW